jgi:4-amino-4-deoxy-L-arabinose transferase-like glycosyltransferase
MLLALAIAVRGIWFGDPVIQVDEQYYLVIGDRMLHGAVPYVDIWDRKPVGLFLLYAGIRLLGGTGIYQYQIVATLFAWATALLIRKIASTVASARASWIAGAIYLLWLDFFTGQGGQSPVFYNALMAGAGLLTLKAMGDDVSPTRRFRLGAVAMILCGLALQIKYSAVFEGVFFGLSLTWRQWRASAKPASTVAQALVWAGIALIPTAIMLLAYVAIGQTQAFVYVNFVSIFQRGNAPAPELLRRLGVIVLLMAPLLVALLIARRGQTWRTHDDRAHAFLVQWFGAATMGLLIFGTYYDHYALPLLVSLCAAIAPAFDVVQGKRRTGLRLAGILAAMGVIATPVSYYIITLRKGHADYIERVASIIDQSRHGGSLYIYDGEPILYLITQAPGATKFFFPYHLSEALEAPSIGVDPTVEMRRLIATHPAVIVDGALQPQWRTPERLEEQRNAVNPKTRLMLDRALARDYRLVAEVPRKKYFRRIWQYKGIRPAAPSA